MSLEKELAELLVPGPKRHPYNPRQINLTLEDAKLDGGYHPSVYRGKARQVVRSNMRERTRMANDK